MAVSEWLGSLTHDGEACNSTVDAGHVISTNASANVTANVTAVHDTSHTFVAGVSLSVVADAIIAVALCIQKYAHNSNKGADGQPIKSFLKLPVWWLGILLNIGGELGNMLAYGLAPAAVVAPVGSVGVVVNEIIAVTFLKEPLRRRDVLGLLLVIGGVVLVIVTVPESDEALSVHHLLSQEILLNPRAYWYLLGLLFTIVFFICYLEPRYAQERILVWLLLCSGISSITVAACRGFASLVTLMPSECFAGHASCVHGVLHPPCTQTIGHFLFWVLLAAIIITAVWSAMYLNKAMMCFGNTEVVPVYYCTFTLMSIVGGSAIYNELGSIDVVGGVLFGAGVLLAFCGVGLLMSGHSQGSAVARPVSKTEPVELESATHSRVDISFRELGLSEKIIALERQPSSSQIVAGVAASLVQASSDATLANGSEAALLAVESANYPQTLASARRLQRRGRLAVGDVARAVFAANSALADTLSESAAAVASSGSAAVERATNNLATNLNLRERVIPVSGSLARAPAASAE